MGARLDAHIHPQTPTQYVVNSCLLYTQTLTNATRYPQFQYRIDILVDTPGVALPVSVQSSFGFLTTHLDTQCCVHAHFGSSSYRYRMFISRPLTGVNTRSRCHSLLTYRSALVDRGIMYRHKKILKYTYIFSSTLPSRWSPTLDSNP